MNGSEIKRLEATKKIIEQECNDKLDMIDLGMIEFIKQYQIKKDFIDNEFINKVNSLYINDNQSMNDINVSKVISKNIIAIMMVAIKYISKKVQW